MGERFPLLERYRAMCVMRAFEEACLEGVRNGELRGELHLAVGQEGVAAGMLGTLRPTDWMVSTHRSHLHAIAKGVPLRPLLAEIYEKATGLCGGKGGHLHLFAPEQRFSTTGIVGSSLPVALGHAYAARLDGTDDVAVGITGDGGVNTGQFHETLNMASLWNAPLIVIVENNQYAYSTPLHQQMKVPDIARRAEIYGMAGVTVDGNDVEAVYTVVQEAVTRARRGGGPTLIEAKTMRMLGHAIHDGAEYVPRELLEQWEARDPVRCYRQKLLDEGVADETELAEIARRVEVEIADALAQAEASPLPDPATVEQGVYAGE